MRITIIVIAALTAFGCGNRKKLSVATTNYISLETTACFGACPIYFLEVLNDGTANLEAKKFMEIEGEFTTMIDEPTMVNIKELIQKAEWETYEESYMTGYSDLPSSIIKYSTIPGDTTTITFESDAAPQELKNLSMRLDRIASSSPWTSTINH